jgi:phasin family protein
MANPSYDHTNKAATAARDAANEAARTARSVSDEAAKVGEHSARAGADMARRGAETARDAMQSGVNAATESFKQVTEQFTKALGFAGPQSEEVARRSSQNIEAISQTSAILARGAQDISREWVNLAQDRLSKNLDAFERLARCRSVHDFVATQSELLRDHLQQVVDTGRRVAELSVQVSDEAAKTIQAQVNENVERVRRAA